MIAEHQTLAPARITRDGQPVPVLQPELWQQLPPIPGDFMMIGAPDRDNYLRVYAQALLRFERELGTGSHDLGVIERYLRDHATTSIAYANAAGAIIGGVSVDLIPETQEAYLHGLFVMEHVSSHGIGGSLLRAALEIALANGATCVKLHVVPDNLRARALYEAAGFGAREYLPTSACAPIAMYLADEAQVEAAINGLPAQPH